MTKTRAYEICAQAEERLACVASVIMVGDGGWYRVVIRDPETLAVERVITDPREWEEEYDAS